MRKFFFFNNFFFLFSTWNFLFPKKSLSLSTTKKSSKLLDYANVDKQKVGIPMIFLAYELKLVAFSS